MRGASYTSRAAVCLAFAIAVAFGVSRFGTVFAPLTSSMAEAVASLVRFLGGDLQVTGNEIYGPERVYVVSPVCVGLYGVSCGVALVAAVRCRWPKRLVLLAAIVAAVVIVNILRIATCVVSGEGGGDSWFRAVHDKLWPVVDGSLVAVLYLVCCRVDKRSRSATDAIAVPVA